MSKEYENIIKEISKQNKDLNSIDSLISKDIIKDLDSIKKTLKIMDERSKRIETTLESLFELINSITIFIEDEGVLDDDELEENENWTPYNEYNYDDNDEEDIGGDNYWSNNEDDT